MNADVTKLRGKTYECPFCEEKIEIRFDKRKGNPYCQCNECGMQLFVRRETGIKRMIEKTNSFWE